MKLRIIWSLDPQDDGNCLHLQGFTTRGQVTLCVAAGLACRLLFTSWCFSTSEDALLHPLATMLLYLQFMNVLFQRFQKWHLRMGQFTQNLWNTATIQQFYLTQTFRSQNSKSVIFFVLNQTQTHLIMSFVFILLYVICNHIIDSMEILLIYIRYSDKQRDTYVKMEG